MPDNGITRAYTIIASLSKTRIFPFFCSSWFYLRHSDISYSRCPNDVRLHFQKRNFASTRTYSLLLPRSPNREKFSRSVTAIARKLPANFIRFSLFHIFPSFELQTYNFRVGSTRPFPRMFYLVCIFQEDS